MRRRDSAGEEWRRRESNRTLIHGHDAVTHAQLRGGGWRVRVYAADKNVKVALVCPLKSGTDRVPPPHQQCQRMDGSWRHRAARQQRITASKPWSLDGQILQGKHRRTKRTLPPAIPKPRLPLTLRSLTVTLVAAVARTGGSATTARPAWASSGTRKLAGSQPDSKIWSSRPNKSPCHQPISLRAVICGWGCGERGSSGRAWIAQQDGCTPYKCCNGSRPSPTLPKH